LYYHILDHHIIITHHHQHHHFDLKHPREISAQDGEELEPASK